MRIGAKKVLNRIQKKGPGSTWTYADFDDLSPAAVAHALSRLAKAGMLQRVSRGVYHYPKQTVMGPSTSSPVAVVQQRFNVIPGGAAAAYNLGLTTQVPARLVFYGEASAGLRTIAGRKMRFQKRNIRHLKALTNQEINILEVARQIKKIPAVSPVDAIENLKQQIGKLEEIDNLLRAVQHEPPRVRALIGAICDELNCAPEKIKSLADTLNPLSSYDLKVGAALSRAAKWRIK